MIIIENMSFPKATKISRTNQHFLLQIKPDPTMKLSQTQELAQTDVINQIHKAGKDLFKPNGAVKVGGNDQVKSGELYGRTVKISEMADAMERYNLVLQVNLSGDERQVAMATANELRAGANISSDTGSFSLVKSGNYLRGIDSL